MLHQGLVSLRGIVLKHADLKIIVTLISYCCLEFLPETTKEMFQTESVLSPPSVLNFWLLSRPINNAGI